MILKTNVFVQIICPVSFIFFGTESLVAANKKSKISANPLKIESKLIEPQADPVLRISNELSKIDESIEKVSAEVEASRLKLIRDAQVSSAARMYLQLDQPTYIQSLQLSTNGVVLYNINNVSLGYPGESPKLLIFEGPVVGESTGFELKMTARKMIDAGSQLEIPKYSEVTHAFSTVNQDVFSEYELRVKLSANPEINFVPKNLTVSKRERGNANK